VTLIEELRKGQTGPVHMVDQLSRAMPEMLWLTAVSQDGSDVTIDGRCTTLTALSDFVGNLEKSGYFRRPVEILDSQVESVPGSSSELIKFQLKATFALPGTEPQPKATAAKARK
jgi:type IV pilus assembly protein PilN